jgi:hypothetical protein
VTFIEDDVVPQDAAALWRLQAEGVLLILMLIYICKDNSNNMAT